MGTGSEVEAGGPFDGMSRLGVWVSDAPAAAAADRSTTRSLQESRGTRVRGYKSGDGLGLQTRYVPTSTSVPLYLGRAGAVRLAGVVEQCRDQGGTYPGGSAPAFAASTQYTLAHQTNNKYCVCYDDTMAFTIYAKET